MATNLAAIIAGSRRNYGVDKYNPDPEARRLALQRALMAQQYQTAMSAPAGPYSGTKKALAGFQLGRQNRAEQRRNALREAARRAYLSQMLAGGTATAEELAANRSMPSVARPQRALMPNEGITAGLDNLGMDMAGQRYFPPNVRDREEAITRDFVLGLTDDEKYNAMGWGVPGDSSSGATDSAQGAPLEDAPTVAEAARGASYDIPAQGMMEWADIEGTSLGGAPLDDTVVTEETEVSGPGGLTIRETGAAEVEDDDDRHLLSQFGDWLLGGRELTPELAAKRVAEMSPAELQKAAGFAPGHTALMEAIRSGDPRQMQLALAIVNPQDLAKHLLTKPKEQTRHWVVVTDSTGKQTQRRLTDRAIDEISKHSTVEKLQRPPPPPVIQPWVGKQYDKISEAYALTMNARASNDRMLAIVKESPLKTGIFTPLLTKFRAVLEQVTGNDVGPALDAAQVLKAMGAKKALSVRNPKSGLGLPGATSNKDLDFLQSIVPGLSKTNRANEALLIIDNALLRRKTDMQEMQMEYISKNTNKGLIGFSAHDANRKLQKKDLFTPDEKRRLDEILKSGERPLSPAGKSGIVTRPAGDGRPPEFTSPEVQR